MIGLPLPGVGAAAADSRDLARSPPPSPASASTPFQTQASSASQPPAISPVLSAAAAAQGGLAPLLADLEAALSCDALPATVRTAAQQVLSFGLQAEAAPTAGDLQALVQRSGLFLEAQLAAGEAPAGDFKALLLGLAKSLDDWGAAEPAAAAPGRPAPPPPFAGGPVRGQAAASSRIDAGFAPGDLTARLLGGTRAALARQTLMQSASARDAAEPGGRGDKMARWLFELPLASAKGRSVAQFEVSRDGRRGGDAEAGPTWRTRFSLDVEGLGPVHAVLALSGAKLHVSLLAETPATQASLAADSDRLRDELQSEGLSAEVSVRSGAPPAPERPAGRFMDTAA